MPKGKRISNLFKLVRESVIKIEIASRDTLYI